MTGLATAVVRDTTALEQLAPEWWALWRRVPSATPFQSAAWLIPWWHAFAPGALFVITVRQAGRLVGLAPFYIEHGALSRRVLPIGIGISDYLDVLLHPECASEAAASIVGCLSTHGREWDEWELSDLPREALALSLLAPFGCWHDLQPSAPCPVLALPRSFDDLLSELSHHKRNNLQNARNRANRRGVVTYIQADSAIIASLFESLVRLHAARWAHRGEAGVLSDPRVLQFHREALPLLLAADLLRLTALRIGDRIAAIHYGLFHNERAYSYITGFDPDFSFESPGALLLAHVIETSIREGAAEFHFLRGQEKYKYEFGAIDRWNIRRVFRQNHVYVRAS